MEEMELTKPVKGYRVRQIRWQKYIPGQRLLGLSKALNTAHLVIQSEIW